LNGADSLIAFSLDGVAKETGLMTQSLPHHANQAVSPVLPEGEGKAAVVKVCGHCHGVETFSRMRMSSAEWRPIVQDMVARGATGTPSEMQQVTDYLGQYLTNN
jgi:hypothetical protein